jgi:hypothetical protein
MTHAFTTALLHPATVKTMLIRIIDEMSCGDPCSLTLAHAREAINSDKAEPELLAHLKMLVLGISEGIDIPKDGAAITAAREAIAKAEGKA